MTNRGFRNAARVALAMAVASLASSCFEDPVAEHLRIEVRQRHRLALSLKVELQTGNDGAPGVLAARMRTLRDAYLHGQDDWSRRFALLTPLADTVKWQKEEGVLKTIERDALIDESDLPRLFTDSALSIQTTHGPGWSELIVFAGRSQRATAAQKALFSDRLDEWCSDVSSYLRSLGDVYDYLDHHPGRAEAVLGSVLKGEMAEEEAKKLPPVTEDEATLIDALNLRMNGVTSVLGVAEGEAFSLNEISSLVNDPFPAIVTVRVPTSILEREGFESLSAQTARVPHLSLWDALPTLGNRWIAPDPLLEIVESSRSGGTKKVDLPAFLGLPRHVAAVPSAADVKASVLEKLKTPSRYRLRWIDPDPHPEPDPQ